MARKGDHSSSTHADIPNKPGVTNWVEKSGGLPSYIRRIARHLVADQGFTVSHAIATAVNTVKKWARGGGGVTAATQAKAAAALASWNAKKGLSNTTSTDNVLQLASSFGGASFQKNLDEIRQGQKDKGKKKPAGKGKGGGSSEKKDEGDKDLKKKAGESPRAASWDESKHKRKPSGAPTGGEFATSGGGTKHEDGSVSNKDGTVKDAETGKTRKKNTAGAKKAVDAARIELAKRKGTGIALGSVSEAAWNRLKAQGWKGRPGDKREALYPPAKKAAVKTANEDVPAIELAGGKALETKAARKKAAAKGQAMPDGSFPMQDVAHIKKAIKARGRAKDAAKREKVKQKIIARLKAKGREDLIPKKWQSGGQGKAAGRSKRAA
jgi:hypothetical protein